MEIAGASGTRAEAKAGFRGNVNPAGDFVDIVRRLATERPGTPLRIAEIGIDKGATSFELVKVLRKGDRLDLFDRDMCRLASNLDGLRAEARCEVEFFPNSTKVHDSYFWTIARMRLSQGPEEAAMGTWDAVYLDGSHTYPADAPTTCLLKEMVSARGVSGARRRVLEHGGEPDEQQRAEPGSLHGRADGGEPHRDDRGALHAVGSAVQGDQRTEGAACGVPEGGRLGGVGRRLGR